MDAPLSGLTVIDFTRVLSGPYCTMQLADMGARVIKIEHPGHGDDTRAWGPPFTGGESAYFLSINRNKESLALDLQRPESRPILDALLDRADVLVENFRPGTMERLGLGYDAVAARWPRIVYCSISGFGQTGPRRDEPGYDAVMQGEGGLMSITGAAGGSPFRLGVAISDIVSGLFAAQGIAMALLARERSGAGQRVDIGMLDATVALLTYQAGIYFATGETPRRMGNRHPTIVPYETLPASDGEFVVAVGNDEMWRRFCEVIEAGALGDDARFLTNRDRVRNYDGLRPLIVERLARRTRDEWVRRLKDAGVPCGSVRDIGEVLQDEHLHERDMIAEVEHAVAGTIRLLGVPVKLSRTPGAVRHAPPTLGQHTGAVLHDLGLSADQIATLRDQGVVGGSR
ncbi:MAG: formyl-CoA transferase [Acidobacteria bacterium RIFCSPLOWO2_02_FULL_67_36]|nr:MAG: formyl-CoA transferase [Acidobacteria bacterium RIFCSPLOWO2_02_FULL_67_36]OFW20557.1 MAG: formyl-CoA transferase [Acidobacteria bacterium RIFCSPLOWO2_12_FULL_66_21]